MGMSFVARQARVRVLERLELRVKRFRSREELWPIRVPREPLALDALVAEALPDDHTRFDPLTLRSRTLLHLAWDEGSEWELWMALLPSGLKLYCDSGGDETRLLASGGRHANDEADRLFLQLLSESAGREFGIEMSGGAPSRVRSSVSDRDFLAGIFVNLFEVTGAEESVRIQLRGAGVKRPRDRDALGTDFRVDVELWLDLAFPRGNALA